jgi:raffinose/stachyose/melibiose transport system substrate-binding protein
MTKRLAAVVAAFMFSASLGACGGGGSASVAPSAAASTGAPAVPSTGASPEPSAADVSGEITVLTHRTDIVDTLFKAEYVPKFNAKYPNVTVKFEAIRDYHPDVKVRMNTDDYGDVLVIPTEIVQDQLPTFFEPLGKVDELSSKYRFLNENGSFDGTVYGIAITGNAQGILYNKKVWADVGITEWAKTTEEFLADLQLIKDKGSATPYYTNYHAGWPMSQWEGHRGEPTANPNATVDLGHDASPWDAGKDHYVIDKLLYDVVNKKLNEDDPTTTDWEPSKTLLATGKVGTMVLGSWAITQFQGAATDAGASPDDIGYMPFPAQVDGTFHASTGGDLKLAINVHSKNKAAARAWVDWFLDESGYATHEGGLPPLVSGEFPSTLADFKAKGVELFEYSPEPAGKEGLADNVAKEAEIDLWGNIYRQRIVDAARGATDETIDKIFSELNTKWGAAKTKLGG